MDEPTSSPLEDAATRREIPPFVQFNDDAREYRDRREEHLRKGGKKLPLPTKAVRLGIEAGMSSSKIAHGLGGVNSSSVTAHAKRNGYKPFKGREMASSTSSVACLVAQSEVSGDEQMIGPLAGSHALGNVVDDAFDFTAVLPSLTSGAGLKVDAKASAAPAPAPAEASRDPSQIRTRVIEATIGYAAEFGVLPVRAHIAVKTSVSLYTVERYYEEASRLAVGFLVPSEAYPSWLKLVAAYRLNGSADMPPELANALVAARIPIGFASSITGWQPIDIEQAYANRSVAPPKSEAPKGHWAPQLNDQALLELACCGLNLSEAASLAGVRASTLANAIERTGLEWTGTARLPSLKPKAPVRGRKPKPRSPTKLLTVNKASPQTKSVDLVETTDPVQALARALAARSGIQPDAPAWMAFVGKAEHALTIAYEL